MQKEWGFEDYGGKHDENIFTRFYQRYILPEKFGIDKRVANYSNYIRSGGLTREQALAKMSEPRYPQAMFEADKRSVLERFKLSGADFDVIMKTPPRPHSDFGSDEWIYNLEKPYVETRRFAGIVLRKLHVIK